MRTNKTRTPYGEVFVTTGRMDNSVAHVNALAEILKADHPQLTDDDIRLLYTESFVYGVMSIDPVDNPHPDYKEQSK